MQLHCLRYHSFAAQHMHAPSGARHHQRAHSLVRNGQYNIHAGHHGCNAEQYLGAERAVNGDRGGARPASYPPRQNEQKTNHNPGPPAVEEMDQIGVIVQRSPDACRPVDPAGNKIVIHQGPGI